MSYFQYHQTWTVEAFETEVGEAYYVSRGVKRGDVPAWAQRNSEVYDTRSGKTYYLLHDKAALR